MYTMTDSCLDLKENTKFYKAIILRLKKKRILKWVAISFSRESS